MRKTCLVLISLVAILLFGACSGAAENAHEHSYVYVRTVVEKRETPVTVEGFFVHEDRIFYYYTVQKFPWEVGASDPLQAEVFIVSILPDGTDRQEVLVSIEQFIHAIHGMRVTEAGNFAMVLGFFDYNGAGEWVSAYAEFDFLGNMIVFEEIKGVIPENAERISVLDGLFTAEGEIVLYVPASMDTLSNVVHIDNRQNIIGRVQTYSTHGLVQARDGRIFAHDWGSLRLREMDFLRETTGAPISLSVSAIHQVVTPGAESTFCLYVNDGAHLLGYCLDTHTATPILNWAEVGLEQHLLYIDFLTHGQISILAIESGRWTEHTLLLFTPVVQT